MPVRHEGDFQRKPIRSWDSWVDDTIREAQERGEFDDLPDQGKPIKLDDTPFAPEMASALRTLKNAGYQPTWMELDKAITRDKRDLQDYLERSTYYLQAKLAEVGSPPPEPESVPVPSPGLWERIRALLLHGENAPIERSRPKPTLDDLVDIREDMREQYLERAAAIDKKITSFHAALPRNLWHLERMRLTPEAAARAFDQACPIPSHAVGTGMPTDVAQHAS
jgi:Domain of unknown function (DUF1992)